MELLEQFVKEVEWEGKEDSWDEAVLAVLKENDIKVLFCVLFALMHFLLVPVHQAVMQSTFREFEMGRN